MHKFCYRAAGGSVQCGHKQEDRHTYQRSAGNDCFNHSDVRVGKLSSDAPLAPRARRKATTRRKLAEDRSGGKSRDSSYIEGSIAGAANRAAQRATEHFCEGSYDSSDFKAVMAGASYRAAQRAREEEEWEYEVQAACRHDGQPTKEEEKLDHDTRLAELEEERETAELEYLATLRHRDDFRSDGSDDNSDNDNTPSGQPTPIWLKARVAEASTCRSDGRKRHNHFFDGDDFPIPPAKRRRVRSPISITDVGKVYTPGLVPTPVWSGPGCVAADPGRPDGGRRPRRVDGSTPGARR